MSNKTEKSWYKTAKKIQHTHTHTKVTLFDSVKFK